VKEFQRLGVFLNDEPGDDEALVFAGRFALIAESEFLLCIHVRGVEAESSSASPDVTEIERLVTTHVPEHVAGRTRIEVHEGTGIAEILRSAKEEQLDLVVVGRRLPHDQQAVGTAFSRLARKAPCSVLVVPDKAQAEFSRFQVLVDGSEHSKLAVQTALAIARASAEPRPTVIIQTVYSMGYGHQYTGISAKEARAQLDAVERRKLEVFLADVDRSGVTFEIVCTCSHQIATAVYDLASARNTDMIVLGSRGMSRASASLLGSTAEGVLSECPLPVLIIKRKGETVRFLDALLGLG
jgi:nucleotide-binding universal stress UspA family protein